MKILLLSCSTGEGHNSAAKAISDVLNSRGVEWELHDILKLLSPRVAKLICNWHGRIYRYVPQLFNMGFKMVEHMTDDNDDSDMLYKVLAHGGEKLSKFLLDGGYDGVICTHVFAGMVITEVRKNYGIDLPFYQVATDYNFMPYTDLCIADGYFISSPLLSPTYEKAGVPADKLIPSGIPIRQAFYSKDAKALAREELQLPESGLFVLMMGGSLGCGPLKKLAKKLLERIPEDAAVAVVCGRNKRLYNSLSKLEDPRFRVLGYIKEIPQYMDAADLIVTKPGGLSSTEAANKHLPMVFMHTVGGCEDHNFKLFLRMGYAVGSKKTSEVLEMTEALLRDPARLRQMEQRLCQDFNRNGSAEIARHIIAAVEARQPVPV